MLDPILVGLERLEIWKLSNGAQAPWGSRPLVDLCPDPKLLSFVWNFDFVGADVTSEDVGPDPKLLKKQTKKITVHLGNSGVSLEKKINSKFKTKAAIISLNPRQTRRKKKSWILQEMLQLSFDFNFNSHCKPTLWNERKWWMWALGSLPPTKILLPWAIPKGISNCNWKS